MSTPQHEVNIGPNDVLRFILEVFAIVSLGIWGFVSWPLPLPGVVFGLGVPALAIIVWALFRSPKAVFRIDTFGKALVEIAIFGSAALAWWFMGQPIVAAVFAIVATVSGIISGRKELAESQLQS